MLLFSRQNSSKPRVLLGCGKLVGPILPFGRETHLQLVNPRRLNCSHPCDGEQGLSLHPDQTLLLTACVWGVMSPGRLRDSVDIDTAHGSQDAAHALKKSVRQQGTQGASTSDCTITWLSGSPGPIFEELGEHLSSPI